MKIYEYKYDINTNKITITSEEYKETSQPGILEKTVTHEDGSTFLRSFSLHMLGRMYPSFTMYLSDNNEASKDLFLRQVKEKLHKRIVYKNSRIDECYKEIEKLKDEVTQLDYNFFRLVTEDKNSFITEEEK